MAKDPAFLFYTQDFSTGTQFFTDEQVGKYIRLLMAQHQHGHLNDNQVLIICKSYDNDVMSKFAKDLEGRWFNERLETEVVKRQKYAESRGKNGKSKKIISKSYDNHSENENTVFVFDNNNTQSSGNSKSENQFHKSGDVELTAIDISQSIEIYRLRTGVLLNRDQISDIFKAFKLQSLDGKTFHADEAAVIKHFKNWLPLQKIQAQQLNSNGRKSLNSLI